MVYNAFEKVIVPSLYYNLTVEMYKRYRIAAILEIKIMKKKSFSSRTNYNDNVQNI